MVKYILNICGIIDSVASTFRKIINSRENPLLYRIFAHGYLCSICMRIALSTEKDSHNNISRVGSHG